VIKGQYLPIPMGGAAWDQIRARGFVCWMKVSCIRPRTPTDFLGGMLGFGGGAFFRLWIRVGVGAGLSLVGWAYGGALHILRTVLYL